MRKIEFNGNELVMYDSIQDLVVGRYQKYNLNVMIDAGIGSDLNSFRERGESVKRLMVDDVDKARKEMDNFMNSVYLIMSETSPEMNSFVVLIHSINGRIINDEDLSEAGVKDLIELLNKKRLRINVVRGFMNLFKKKIDEEFETFFPKIVESSKTKELYLMLRKKIGLKMREIYMGVDLSDDLRKIEKFFIGKMKVKAYGGANGLEVKMINGFDDMCTVLEKNGLSQNPKKLTVVEFYNKLIFLEKMIKENSKNK